MFYLMFFEGVHLKRTLWGQRETWKNGHEPHGQETKEEKEKTQIIVSH